MGKAHNLLRCFTQQQHCLTHICIICAAAAIAIDLKNIWGIMTTIEGDCFKKAILNQSGK